MLQRKIIPALIEVAKVSFLPVQSTKFVKGKIYQPFYKNSEEIYLIKNCLQKENIEQAGENTGHF